MKIWMPYIEGGSGTDTYTRYLAAGFLTAGHEVCTQRFNRYYQFVPHLLSQVKAPPETDIILANTSCGFVFARPCAKMVAVEHLFILDRALTPYKSRAQRLYHELMVKRFVELTIDAADAVIAVSNYTAQALSRNLGVPLPRVILNGIDTDFFSPAPTDEDRRPRQHRVRLLFVGNLTRRKGADLLKPIMQELGEGFELYYTEGLRKNRFATQGSANMKPLGRLDRQQIRDAYRNSDILLFPSRGEGMSCAVMESMACGTPVVAANISSLPEALAEGGGVLCRPDDPGDFAGRIRAMLPRLDGLSREAREVAVRRFSLARMTRDYLALFEELLRAG